MDEEQLTTKKEPVIWEEKNSEPKKKNENSTNNGECDTIGKTSKKNEKKGGSVTILEKKRPRIANLLDFVNAANEVHGHRYSYTESVYILSNIKLKIICKLHGEFYQSPNSHLSGVGCPKCANIRRGNSSRLDLDTFLSSATLIHGDMYDYSKFKYISTDTKGIIICSMHGEFLQTPNNHISQTHGCPRCGVIKCSNSIRSNTDEFIRSANIIHKYAYGYEFVKYIDNRTKVNILCYICNIIFKQTPNSHLNGQRCPNCYGNPKYSTQTYIDKANIIHNFKYDYSKVIYINSIVHITIICPIHGKFQQSPASHLHGYGCSKCSCSRISKSEIEFLEYLRLPDTPNTRQVKIFQKKVDGYDPVTNTIYEFLGDYWHGNPAKYRSDYYNQRCKKLAGQLYSETNDKLNTLKSNGYVVKYIWEYDWKNFKLRLDKEPKIITL